MSKTIFRYISYLVFCSVLFFNLSLAFAEAKAVASGQAKAVGESLTEGTSLTVYNQNRALIKEKRFFDLDKGINHVDWDGLASTINVGSVSLSSVNVDKPVEVKEQNYQSDLISTSAILNRSIGKSIYLRRFFNDGKSEEQLGVLVGSPSTSERVVKIGDRYVLNPEGQIEISEIPSGLVSQPQLSFVVKALEAGKKNLLLTYEASSINWQCDYNVLLNSEQNKFDLTGWVTLTNQCGLGFKNSSLKLIAGNVQTNRAPKLFRQAVFAQADSVSIPSPQEQAFADYHLYTFPGTVDINNNETKRLTLVERKAIPVVKKYIFDQQYYVHAPQNQKVPVEIKLEFQNDEKYKQPFPAGEVRVYQADADNDLQLIGEDRITHTATGEKTTIKLGEAFDITAEKTRINSEQTSNHRRKDTFKVTFNNHLDKDVVITDIEHVPDLANISVVIPDSTIFGKVNSNTFQTDFKIPANGTVDLEFTVESKF
jgi:hypothetical protein